MLDSLYIGSYRGLQEVMLSGFSDINIFVGMNNAGKTSALESIILSGILNDEELLVQMLISRYQQMSIEFLKDMFAKQEKPLIVLKRKMKETFCLVEVQITYQEEEKTLLSGTEMKLQKKLELLFQYQLEFSSKENKKTRWEYAITFIERDGSIEIIRERSKENEIEEKIPCEFVSFSRFDRTNYLISSIDSVLEQDKRAALLQVLQLFDPMVENFEVIGKKRNIKVFSKNQKKPLSLYDYGNGMYKAFYIASAALLSENGVLLIDEIETGIHKEALCKFIKYLIQICREKKIQLFLTTHSLETLDLFLEHEKEQLDRIAAYHLRNDGEKTQIRRYTGGKLANLREKIGLDIR